MTQNFAYHCRNFIILMKCAPFQAHRSFFMDCEPNEELYTQKLQINTVMMCIGEKKKKRMKKDNV